MTATTTLTDYHAVYATLANGDRVRLTDPLMWSVAQYEWSKLDDARVAGLYPHVRHFEVRSTDDPGYRDAPVKLTLRPVKAGQRGTTEQRAARLAWRAFAPTFRSAWDKRNDRLHREQGLPEPHESTGVQGTGGWFYYANGETACQGVRDLAAKCRRMGLTVQGQNGKWYVTDQGTL